MKIASVELGQIAAVHDGPALVAYSAEIIVNGQRVGRAIGDGASSPAIFIADTEIHDALWDHASAIYTDDNPIARLIADMVDQREKETHRG